MTLTLTADTLVFSGPLDRGAAARLWPQAQTLLDGVHRFDLTAVSAVDSAGLALLAELAARRGGGVTVIGRPSGLDELRAAYRLEADLSFAT